MVDILIIAGMLALGFGFVWFQLHYLPQRRRAQAQAYLDVMDDPFTDRVATGRRSTRTHNTTGVTLAYAEAAFRGPWAGLTVVLAGPVDPRAPDAVVIPSAHHDTDLVVSIGPPALRAAVASDASLQTLLRGFVSGSRRTIQDGQVRVEVLDDECDAMELASMEAEVAELLRRVEAVS